MYGWCLCTPAMEILSRDMTTIADNGFDGDELNGSLCLDEYIADGITPLAPHKSVFNLTEPRMVSKNLSIADTVVSTIASWINYEEPVDSVKLDRMSVLLDNREENNAYRRKRIA